MNGIHIHKNTYFDDWPDGDLEVCKDCGFSRVHREWDESYWMKIDIEKERIELQKALDDL